MCEWHWTWYELGQLRSSLNLLAIIIGIHLRQALQQLLQPRDEISEFVFHVIVLLVGNR